ncbi:TonB-dependent receptor [Chitinophaga sp. XS-30]|uniref:TonB-dependent receptor n=1 Tax=Chitinophaga sp. XS-30 TaxID=2604421 RepID=UPI0011DDE7AF|nr:TonB-dependent receptor [Chitinophaga sp. XS-30]QEH41046.1 TonB-dependent receptor [Chitinophaga sp. XS-30]
MKRMMLLALLGLSTLVHAQTVITGTVTDKSSGRPLQGATITLSKGGSTYTDAKGQYRLAAPANGAYIIQASFLGYKTLRQTASEKTQYDFALEETGLFVKPVEIASLRAGRDAPFTRSELNKEAIASQNLGQDLPMLLNQLPSVVTSSDAGAGVGYTGLRVRGSDITRINVTVNGIPVNDAESQGTFFVNMPDFASSVNSIQLQRGVGTSTNGAGAFGASLNLSTNEYNETAYGGIDNSYGSFDTWKHTVKAGSGLINGHFTLDARLSKISSNGYIDRASSDLRSFYTSAAYISAKTAIRLNVFSGKEKTYQAWNGIDSATLRSNRTYNPSGANKPGEPYDNETDNYQQDHYQLFLNQSINSQLNFNIGLHYTRGRGYYENYRDGESYADFGVEDPIYNGAPVATTDLIRQLWLDNHFYGGVFSFNRTAGKFNWSLGGALNRYDGKHYGKVIWAQHGGFDKDRKWYDLDAFKTDANIYWKGELSVTDKLKIFADVQYRHVNYELNGFRNNPDIFQHQYYNFFNPKGGLSFRLNEQQHVYASYAIGNKEPNRDDFEAGLEEVPKHETLRNLEAGYVLQNSKAGLQANVYYMNYRNQLVLTGRINDVGAYARTNIPKSYRLGLELNGHYNLLTQLTLAGNIAFSRNRISGFTEYLDDWDNGGQKPVTYEDTDISFSPDLVAGYTVSYRPVSGLTLDWVGKYVGRQFLDNTSSEKRSLDAFIVNDVRINYTVPQQFFRSLGLQLMLNNIFSEKYEPNGYTYGYIDGGVVKADNYYFPMAGFNFMAGVKIGL